MKPFTTLQRNNIVIVWRKTQSQLSSVQDRDIGKVFIVQNVEYDGRRHNQYICNVLLRNKEGREIRACVDEIARCNPNFEPEGEYVVCIGCGATIADIDLKTIKHLNNVKSCPSCGTLEPTSS